MPPEPGDFSIALSILRISRGWSQDQVAKASGLTNSALSEYERGKKIPELKSVRKIVRALGYELSAIERTEEFLRELRAESHMEARLGEDGSFSLVPISPHGSPGLPPNLPPSFSPNLPTHLPTSPASGGMEVYLAASASDPLRTRARRVAAQVGQAATGFSLLLFDLLIGHLGQPAPPGDLRQPREP
jgi:transcriptional regulator with XRE-family HTH domain